MEHSHRESDEDERPCYDDPLLDLMGESPQGLGGYSSIGEVYISF